MIAAGKGYSEIVKELLSYGANVDATDEVSITVAVCMQVIITSIQIIECKELFVNLCKMKLVEEILQLFSLRVRITKCTEVSQVQLH